jgi:hypothetical protein
VQLAGWQIDFEGANYIGRIHGVLGDSSLNDSEEIKKWGDSTLLRNTDFPIRHAASR